MAARGPYAEWIRKQQFAIARRMLPPIRRRITSETLKRFLQFYERSDGKAVIGVPHYWAAYYHDGNNSFSGRPTRNGKTYLVFFADPLANDPRLQGTYPIRYAEWRPLTKEEFLLGVEINKAIAGTFNGPFMFVTTFQGARPGNPFFLNTNPSRVAREIVPKAFSALVKKTLGRNFKRKVPTTKAKLKVSF